MPNKFQGHNHKSDETDRWMGKQTEVRQSINIQPCWNFSNLKKSCSFSQWSYPERSRPCMHHFFLVFFQYEKMKMLRLKVILPQKVANIVIDWYKVSTPFTSNLTISTFSSIRVYLTLQWGMTSTAHSLLSFPLSRKT